MRGCIIDRGKRTKNKKANWGYVVDLGIDKDGKRQREWKSGFATKRDAEEALNRRLVELAENKNLRSKPQPRKLRRKSGRITLADYSANWLDDRKDIIRISSWNNYEWAFRCHINPALGNKFLHELTEDDIRSLLKSKEGALKTRQRIYNALRIALGEAVGTYLSTNPCTEKLRPKQERRPRDNKAYTVFDLDLLDEQVANEDPKDLKVHAMTDEQCELFLSIIRGTRFYAAHLLAVRRGLRRGEVLGLRWTDIDFNRQLVTVNRSLVALNGKPVFHPPKTEKSRRTILLSDELVDALRAHKEAQDVLKAERKTYVDYRLVFPTIDGKPFDPNRFYSRHFKKLIAKHDTEGQLKDFTFHDLRHTAATMMLKAGVNFKVLSEILGHASVAFTMRVYQHVLPGMQEEALRAYDSQL